MSNGILLTVNEPSLYNVYRIKMGGEHHETRGINTTLPEFRKW